MHSDQQKILSILQAMFLDFLNIYFYEEINSCLKLINKSKDREYHLLNENTYSHLLHKHKITKFTWIHKDYCANFNYLIITTQNTLGLHMLHYIILCKTTCPLCRSWWSQPSAVGPTTQPTIPPRWIAKLDYMQVFNIVIYSTLKLRHYNVRRLSPY